MFHSAPTAQIEIGSIGWEGEDEYIFFGDPGNDGHTFIRVQLFRGRDITKPLNAKRAQGTKVLCSLNSVGGFRIPPKDTRCYVAVPPGMEEVPGAAIIMGTVEPHSQHFDLSKNGDQVMSAGQGQGRTIMKNDGSVVMFTTFDNTKDGQSVYFKVAKDAFMFVAPWGTIRFDVSGFHINHVSGAQFDLGGIYGLPAPFDADPFKQLSSYIQMAAGSIISETVAAQFSAGATNQTTVAGTDAVKLTNDALQTQIVALAGAVRDIEIALAALSAVPAVVGVAPGLAVVAQLGAAHGSRTAGDLVIDTQEPLVNNAQLGTSISADPAVPV